MELSLQPRRQKMNTTMSQVIAVTQADCQEKNKAGKGTGDWLWRKTAVLSRVAKDDRPKEGTFDEMKVRASVRTSASSALLAEETAHPEACCIQGSAGSGSPRGLWPSSGRLGPSFREVEGSGRGRLGGIRNQYWKC